MKIIIRIYKLTGSHPKFAPSFSAALNEGWAYEKGGGAVAREEEQLGRCAARKSKYIRLYLYIGKLKLAAAFIRRVLVDGRSFAEGAPALPLAPAAQNLGAGIRRPCRGQVCGGMLGAMF